MGVLPCFLLLLSPVPVPAPDPVPVLSVLVSACPSPCPLETSLCTPATVSGAGFAREEADVGVEVGVCVLLVCRRFLGSDNGTKSKSGVSDAIRSRLCVRVGVRVV